MLRFTWPSEGFPTRTRAQPQPWAVFSSSGREQPQAGLRPFLLAADAKRKRWRGDGDVGRIGEGLEGCGRAEMGWSVRS